MTDTDASSPLASASAASRPDYSKRQALPDLVRVWALLGIVLVNVCAFAWPIEQLYFAGGLQSGADIIANNLVTTLFMTKAYALFSLMFGMGLAFQINRARRKGVAAGPRHFRRMAGLFMLGLMHASFFFIGDVLMTYAVLGCLLYAFRLQSPKALTIVGICLISFQGAFYLLAGGAIYLAETMPEEADLAAIKEGMEATIPLAKAAFGSGTFMDAAAFRISLIPVMLANGVLAAGFSVLGFFLLGLAAVKKGYINTPEADFWRKCRWVALPIGLLASIFATSIFTAANDATSSATIIGIALLTLAAPFSAFGYAGWIAKYAVGPDSPLKAFLARAGTATLSAYLLQSVILSFIFSAYGLGLYASLGAAKAIAIAFITGIASIVFASLWRAKFDRGPVEMLLRRWTYLGKD